MHSPQICTPGALGRCVDQCPRIYDQNMPQVVSLDSRVPSGKCHCLTHISQISSITQPMLLPLEQTGLCPRRYAGCCQVRPTLLSVSDLMGFPSCPSEPAEFPLPQTQHKTLSSVLQANRKALCLYPPETKKGEETKCSLSRAPCASWEAPDKASTNGKRQPGEVLLIPLQHVRPVAGVTLKQHIDHPPEVSHVWCWLFGSFHPSNGESLKMDQILNYFKDFHFC